MHLTFDLIIPVFGELKIAFTDAKHAHVSGDITVRGVRYHVGVHIFEHNDKRFRVGKEGATPYEVYQQLYVSRPDNWKKGATDAARKTIQEQVELTANNFIVNNRSVLQLAEREDLQTTLERAEYEYAEAVKKADEARKVRDTAQDAYSTFVLRGGK